MATLATVQSEWSLSEEVLGGVLARHDRVDGARRRLRPQRGRQHASLGGNSIDFFGPKNGPKTTRKSNLVEAYV